MKTINFTLILPSSFEIKKHRVDITFISSAPQKGGTLVLSESIICFVDVYKMAARIFVMWTGTRTRAAKAHQPFSPPEPHRDIEGAKGRLNFCVFYIVKRWFL